MIKKITFYRQQKTSDASGPCLSVAHLEGNEQPSPPTTIVGAQCRNNASRRHGWNTVATREPTSSFTHTVTTGSSSKQWPWIPLLSLIPVFEWCKSTVLWAVVINEETCWRNHTWCKVKNKHPWNFSILQIVQRSNLVDLKGMFK
jgi:hypothetical protein